MPLNKEPKTIFISLFFLSNFPSSLFFPRTPPLSLSLIFFSSPCFFQLFKPRIPHFFYFTHNFLLSLPWTIQFLSFIFSITPVAFTLKTYPFLCFILSLLHASSFSFSLQTFSFFFSYTFIYYHHAPPSLSLCSLSLTSFSFFSFVSIPPP